MMLNILNPQKIELAGLDIGSSAVRLVRLNKSDDGYTLIAATSESIVPCPDDEKQQRQNCVDAIRTCLQKAELKNGSVVCGISGPEVVVRGFTFPPLPDAAVEQAVRMEAQQVCPLDMKHSVLDFQLIETPQMESTAKPVAPAARQGVMTVGTESVIQEQMDLLAQAGAKPVMVDVNALALLNCLNELELPNTQETVAVIDIGHMFIPMWLFMDLTACPLFGTLISPVRISFKKSAARRSFQRIRSSRHSHRCNHPKRWMEIYCWP
jgi:Tfp pilus assembly PilM family ATPase